MEQMVDDLAERWSHHLIKHTPDAIAWRWTRGGGGVLQYARWARASGRSCERPTRETRLTHRPGGCRAHFAELLRCATPECHDASQGAKPTDTRAVPRTKPPRI